MNGRLPDCEHGIDAGAYLLQALPPADHHDFAMHLHVCDACRQEVAELQLVVDTLPMAAPQLVPPPELKDRIMRVVDAEAQLLRAAGPEADRVPAAPVRERRVWRWGSGLAIRPAFAGGIASVLIAVGVAGGALLDGGAEDPAKPRVLAAEVTAPGASARVSLQGGRATLHVAQLPSAPAGRIYQVWVTRKGSTAPTPTHTLFSVRKSDGRSTVPIDEDITDVAQILVTEEVDGGSLTPTGKPLITAALS